MWLSSKTSLAWIIVALSSIVGVAAEASFSRPAGGTATGPPRVFLLDAQMLTDMKSGAAEDPRRRAVLSAVVVAADIAMHEGPFSVVQKAVVPPAGTSMII